MVRTQWRVVAGMGGVLHTGLDYSSVQTVLNLEVPAEEHREAWQAIRIMELAARDVLNEG